MAREPSKDGADVRPPVLKRIFYVFFVLTAVAFIGGLAAGFTVDVHPPSSEVSCGAPLRVIDGHFVVDLPEEFKADCQDAADKWIGLLLIAFFAAFIPAFAIGLILARRGETWK